MLVGTFTHSTRFQLAQDRAVTVHGIALSAATPAGTQKPIRVNSRFRSVSRSKRRSYHFQMGESSAPGKSQICRRARSIPVVWYQSQAGYDRNRTAGLDLGAGREFS